VSGEPVDERAVQEAVRRAVADALAPFGQHLDRWVMIGEAFGLDGQRAVWLATGEGTKAWEVLGLINFMDAMERGRIMQLATEGDQPG
jgi:hypothetical protein